MRLFSRCDFEKADPVTSSEAARLDRLSADLQGDLRAAFDQFVAQATDDQVIAEVADKLERGDVDGALDLIRPYITQLGTMFPQLYQTAAIAETAALVQQIRALRPTLGISFDVGDPVAAALMRENQLEFVTAFDDAQIAATREALTEGLQTGQGFATTARAFRDSIGLAQNQVQAVRRYRQLLEANSRQALDRTLRDRRFDPSVERAIADGRPLSADQIDRMVQRYQERQLASRADTIARTETVKILSEAQEQAFAQVQRDAEIPDDDVEETWLTTMDGRERFTHGVMNGQTIRRGGLFQSPSGARLRYPGDPNAPAAEVISCRCRRHFRIILANVQRRAA